LVRVLLHRASAQEDAFQQAFPGKTYADIDELNSSGELARWIRRVRKADKGVDPINLSPGEVGGGYFHPRAVRRVLDFEEQAAALKQARALVMRQVLADFSKRGRGTPGKVYVYETKNGIGAEVDTTDGSDETALYEAPSGKNGSVKFKEFHVM